MVVTKGPTHVLRQREESRTHWRSLKRGLRQTAEDSGYDVSFESTRHVARRAERTRVAQSAACRDRKFGRGPGVSYPQFRGGQSAPRSAATNVSSSEAMSSAGRRVALVALPFGWRRKRGRLLRQRFSDAGADCHPRERRDPEFQPLPSARSPWMPACAGMTWRPRQQPTPSEPKVSFAPDAATDAPCSSISIEFIFDVDFRRRAALAWMTSLAAQAPTALESMEPGGDALADHPQASVVPYLER
jgi:hypothetical protein